MPRYALRVEYHGGPFAGWQRQDNAPSVQETLETACAALTGEPASVQGAGRTDSGVHAHGQVAHVDLPKAFPPDTVRDALNHHMAPAPVAVTACAQVAEVFHARFDAVERSYRYRLVDRRAPLTLDKGLAWRVPQRLDAEAMHAGAQALVGTHDFTTFRDAQCQADSPVKSLDAITVSRIGEEVVVATRARSFLHRQVRSIVGSLVEVGRGKWSTPAIARVLAAADRSACGPVAPPDGLYLVAVRYPNDPFSPPQTPRE